MHFHIITIFPNLFDSYLSDSIIKRAIESGDIKISFYNPRDFTKNKHKKVDNIPYGGGPGMVMMVQPILDTWSYIIKKNKPNFLKKTKDLLYSKKKNNIKTIILSPAGQKFNTDYAKTTVQNYTDIILICGRYEGIDARVAEITRAELISIGDYVLTGGELAAMVMVDSISRQVDGVLGNKKSLEEERVSSHNVYTRPEVFNYKNKEFKVPEVLLSGNHKKIDNWRKNH